jgi:thiamine-monophosphate kinase
VSKHPIQDEFALIERVFAPLARDNPGAFGLTDDAAVLDVAAGCRLVATADAMVAGVHFRQQDPAALVARKLLRVNLSDLAAMGARPKGYLLTIMLPPDTESGWIEAFAGGLAEDQEIFGVALLGGDTVGTSGPMSLALTALGEVKAGAELRRAGARVGDAVYVSGTVGDGALGLAALEGRLDTLSEAGRRALAGRYQLPEPRLRLGSALSGIAHATIDVSDGLAADLGHIAESSGVGAVIEAPLVPLSEAAAEVLAADPGWWRAVLAGGDDYELLFTAGTGAAAEISALALSLDLPLTEIGRIGSEKGVRALDESGNDIPLDSPGFRHF